MINLKFTPLLVAFLLVSTTADSNFSISDQPEWVTQRSYPTKETHDQSFPFSYLLFDQQIDVTDANQSHFFRFVSKVNNSKGLSEMGKITIDYDPNYQKLNVHHVNIIRGDSRIDALKMAEFDFIRQEKELNINLYNGKETAVLLLDGLEVDDIIDYSYTITGTNPIFNNRFFEVFDLAWGIPVSQQFINISLPKKHQIKYRSKDKITEPTITQNKERKNFQWHFEDIEAIDYQGNYPKWYEVSNYLEVTDFRSWSEVAQWAINVFQTSNHLGTELENELVRWNQLPTDEMKASKALQFVQDRIRYFGVEIGVNSHKPRVPSETLASKYGDCKDKTMLLHAILEAMNIQSIPVLVSTHLTKSLNKRLPSPGLFNHVILQINIGEEQFWVDPTNTFQSSPLNRIGLPDFSLGLPIEAKTKRLSSIDRKTTQFVKKRIDEAMALHKDLSGANLTINSHHSGSLAEHWREQIHSNPTQIIQNQFESFTKKLYGSAKSEKDISFIDDPQANEFTIEETYSLSDPWKRSSRWESVEFFAYGISDLTQLPSRLNRDSPLGLAYPIEIEHHFHINDESENATINEKNIEISTNQIEYKKKIEKEKGQIKISHHLKILSDHVPFKEVDHHIQSLEKINDELSDSIILPIEKKARVKKSNDKLKSALQEMLKEKNNEQ